jgi:WD40 repeat protein
MKPKLNFDFKDPINVAAISPDGNLLGVYGDCLQAEILDLRSGEVITTLHGHTDFGFSLCWHPNGKILATGNQDLTCKIWDVRYLNQNSSAYCIKTLECAIGASADVKFAGRGGS